MAKKVKAFEANDGALFATEEAADRHNEALERAAKRERLKNVLEDIRIELPHDHPSKPWRNGGDDWTHGMLELIEGLFSWHRIVIIHENFDAIKEQVEK